MAKLADAHGLGPCSRKGMEVRLLSSALNIMGPEQGNTRNQSTPEKSLERLLGYFEGKFSEIDQEIADFRRLGAGARVDNGQIIRPDLSIEALERVRAELEETRHYFIGILQNLFPNLKEQSEDED